MRPWMLAVAVAAVLIVALVSRVLEATEPIRGALS